MHMHTNMTLTWHWLDVDMTPTWHKRDTDVTLTWHRRETDVTLEWHWRDTGVTLAWHWRDTCVTLTVHWHDSYMTLTWFWYDNGMALAQHWHHIDMTLKCSRYVIKSDNIMASRTSLKDSENKEELLDCFGKLATVALIFMFKSTQSKLTDNLAMTVLTTENWFYISTVATRPFVLR